MGLLTAVLVLAEVAFLLWIPQFVTVDGATHVGGAALIRDVLRGDGSLHLAFVQLARFPAPNLLPELLLGVAMLAFDPLTAEKLFQIVYVVALPIALLYAVRGVRPASSWLVALALPMTFTFAFQYGFYDFTFGVVLFLVGAGYAWRQVTAERTGWRAAVVLGALAAIVYLTHIVAFVELILFVGTVVAWRVVTWRGAGEGTVRTEIRRLFPLLVGLAPSVAFGVVFFVATASGIPAHWHPILLQIAGVLSLSLGLASLDKWELVLSALLALALFVLAGAALRPRLQRAGRRPRLELRPHDAFLAFAVVAALAAMVAPSEVRSGGSFIPERLTLFPVYGLGLWLAASPFGRRAVSSAGVAFAALAAGFFAVRLPTYLQLSQMAQEYVSVAPCGTQGATLVQVNLWLPTAGSLARTDPFTEETGRLAAVTRGHDLGNFEGSFPFFLFRNRAENDPFAYLATSPTGFEDVPPGIDLDAFAQRPGAHVDEVIIFGRPNAAPETLASPSWSVVSAPFDSQFQLVRRSSGGLVELYRRTDAAGPSAVSGDGATGSACGAGIR